MARSIQVHPPSYVASDTGLLCQKADPATHIDSQMLQKRLILKKQYLGDYCEVIKKCVESSK